MKKGQMRMDHDFFSALDITYHLCWSLSLLLLNRRPLFYQQSDLMCLWSQSEIERKVRYYFCLNNLES